MNFKSRPWDRWLETCGSIPSRRIFFFQNVETKPVTYAASYIVEIGGLFPRVNRLGRQATTDLHLLPGICLHGMAVKHKDDITFSSQTYIEVNYQDLRVWREAWACVDQFGQLQSLLDI